jgi:hypothetical protein
MGSVIKDVGSSLGLFKEPSARGITGTAEMTTDEAFRQAQLLKEQGKNQSAFGNQLYDQASGKAPSVAEMQMRAAQDRSLAQQVAMAKANRSANPGLMARNQAVNAANQAQQVNQAAAQARLQEQLANQQQYASYINQQQNSVANMMGHGAQAQSQRFGADAANANAENQFVGGMMQTGAQVAAMMSDKNEKYDIKKEGMKSVSDENQKTDVKKEDSWKKVFADAGERFSGMKKPGEQNNMDFLNAALGGDLFAQAMKGSQQGNGFASMGSGIKGFASMLPMSGETAAAAPALGGSHLGAMALMEGSDEKIKKDIKEEQPKKADNMSPKSFLDALQAYSYEYKNPEKPGAGDGRFLSVMAQDLEKAGPVGRSMVSENQDGDKMVDYGKGFGAILAAQADLNKRLSEIEQRKRK